MIRRNTLAAAVALVVASLAAGAAHAASPLTLKCVSAESKKLRTCIADCRNSFKDARAACFGPGLACALACQNANDACLVPVNATLKTCNDACGTNQSDTITVCRSQFANGLITQTELDSCANTARLASLDCRLACTGQIDQDRLQCGTNQSTCLGACASCATPNQCPTP